MQSASEKGDWRKSSTIKDQFNYTYDYAGNRTSRDIPTSVYATNTLDQAYTYDGLHRLKDTKEGSLNTTTSLITTLKFAQDWSLDALGNWATFKQDNDGNTTWDLNQGRTHNGANELTQIASSSTHVACDAAGNMTKVTQPGGFSLHFDLKYDAWNRLVSVEDGPSGVANYEYDGLHRRITKLDVDPGNTFHYYYNTDWQVLEVRLNSEAGTKVEQNVWHPYYVDALAVRYYDSNSDGDYIDSNETEFPLHDANFNITSLVNTSGTVIERYTYSAYGQLAIRDASFGGRAASSFANPYTYTGRRFDSETGLYYYRNRYYDSQLGRFVSRDPIRYRGRSLSLYCYVASRPLGGRDPSGLLVEEIGAGGVAATFVAGAAIDAAIPDPADAAAPVKIGVWGGLILYGAAVDRVISWWWTDELGPAEEGEIKPRPVDIPVDVPVDVPVDESDDDEDDCTAHYVKCQDSGLGRKCGRVRGESRCDSCRRWCESQGGWPDELPFDTPLDCRHWNH